ncbi:hypothetical protein K504DRAFT_447936 [Pleomassaria siparia CBS 279.74]|uniref:Alpha-acetolactate decarboxylase n=1 Tax=Pleomassaria siparia CBS 279.74 TaxID=1314801 RepID=A0A6G1K032_9PLEO|nr:hypothetical protein K504DRAFT_447936 [Pleomassaria siparia CBS 279.74]
MVASIPNDVFQFSTYTAVTRGFNIGQPRTADLASHGTDGIGVFEDGSLMLLNAMTAFSINKGKVQSAQMDARLSFAMVTVFHPTQETRMQSLDAKGLNELLANKDLGSQRGVNSLVPFKITATFPRIRVDGGQEEKEGVSGVLFGFAVPTWMEAISGPRIHCHLIASSGSGLGSGHFGGRVDDFEAVDVTLSFAKCGRFHLGFPQGASKYHNAHFDGDDPDNWQVQQPSEGPLRNPPRGQPEETPKTAEISLPGEKENTELSSHQASRLPDEKVHVGTQSRHVRNSNQAQEGEEKEEEEGSKGQRMIHSRRNTAQDPANADDTFSVELGE